MADVPSAIIGSAAQAAIQARDVAGHREARVADATQAAKRQTRVAEEAGGMVDTADADSRVFTDAEGQGSQGRPFEDAGAEQPTEEQGQSEDTGINTRPDGTLHIDLQA